MNRLQDSFFYQQFSYEVQTGAGTNEYLNELKKAVHPAGFAVFGKVSIATPISEPMTLSELTDAISISAFSGDPDFFRFVRRSLGTMDLQSGAQDEVIVLESSTSISDTEEFFLLEDGALLLQETFTAKQSENEFTIQLETNEDRLGVNDKLLTEDDFHINGFSKETVVESNNLILDGTQDGLALQDSKNAGSDLLDESGNPIDLENEPVTFTRFVHERINKPVGINHDAIINEDGGFDVSERSGKSDSIQQEDRYTVDLTPNHHSHPTDSS